MAAVLAEWALKKDIYVYGTVYDVAEHRALSLCTQDKKYVDRMRGSKYIPAFTEDGIRQCFSTSKQVLFIGTPCMVYSMKKLVSLLHQEDRFYFVDFVCHGVPSLEAWKSCIHMLEEKQKGKVEDVSFRSKYYGWHNKTIEYTLNSAGQEVYIRRKRKDDWFMRLFDASFLQNESCFTCPANNQYSAADIRLGDCWGSMFENNDLGVSRLAICTDKGRILWEHVSDKLEFGECEEISYKKDNTYYLLPRKKPQLKQEALRLLQQGKDCKDVWRLYCHSRPLKNRLWDKLPKQVQNWYHSIKNGMVR